LGGMDMIKVNFKSHNKEVYCNKGDKLLEVARNSNIFIDAPCNGNISCGKCKVKLLKGKVDTKKTLHIKDEEWEQGYVLACNTNVIEDIEIEVPSKLSSSMHGMKIEGSDKKKDKEIFDRAKNIIETHNLEFKTNIVKTYSKSSDLANMFASGEILVAVGPDFAYGNIVKACPDAKYIVPESGTYLNFNTINMNKDSKNKDAAYDFLNFALSAETQTRTAKGYSEAPTNGDVKLSDEEAKNLTYGPMVDKAHTIDFKVVNPLMAEWIDKWNRLMN